MGGCCQKQRGAVVAIQPPLIHIDIYKHATSIVECSIDIPLHGVDMTNKTVRHLKQYCLEQTGKIMDSYTFHYEEVPLKENQPLALFVGKRLVAARRLLFLL